MPIPKTRKATSANSVRTVSMGNRELHQTLNPTSSFWGRWWRKSSLYFTVRSHSQVLTLIHTYHPVHDLSSLILPLPSYNHKYFKSRAKLFNSSFYSASFVSLHSNCLVQCAGEAVGKSSLVPVPYEWIQKDPSCVVAHGLPEGVTLKKPSEYDTKTLMKILEQSHRIQFTVKRWVCEARACYSVWDNRLLFEHIPDMKPAVSHLIWKKEVWHFYLASNANALQRYILTAGST